MLKRTSPAFASSSLDAEFTLLCRLVDELRVALSKDGRKTTDFVSELLVHGGALAFPSFRAWTEDPDPQVRKTLVYSVAKAADARDPFRAIFLFSLLTPLLWDKDRQVRTQARRVLCTKLLPTYPEDGLETLAQWAAEPDPQKKILAAQYLSNLPVNMAKRVLIVLRNLGRTKEKEVCHAVLRTLKTWKKRAPQVVDAELTCWEKDPELFELTRRVRE